MHRLLYRGYCTLSSYIHAHTSSVGLNTGYIPSHGYITPLHVPALVVGRVHTRIAVCNTGTTKLPQVVKISYMVSPVFQVDIVEQLGSTGLVRAIHHVMQQMAVDDITPPGFIPLVTPGGTADLPLTLGYNIFPDKYNRIRLSTTVDNKKSYVVPTSCPDKRYLAPCDLGSTMVCNSAVLVFPDVNQYLVVGPE